MIFTNRFYNTCRPATPSSCGRCLKPTQRIARVYFRADGPQLPGPLLLQQVPRVQSTLEVVSKVNSHPGGGVVLLLPLSLLCRS